jgi:hypothetical protein
MKKYFFITAQGGSRFVSFTFECETFFNSSYVSDFLNKTVFQANWIIVFFKELTKEEFEIYND